jgi:hypothetical protein
MFTSGKGVAEMTSEETRIQKYVRYMKAAEDARQRAAQIEQKDAAEMYLRIADSWLALADEIAKGGH